MPYSKFWRYLKSTGRSEGIVHRFNPSFLDTGKRWRMTIFQTEEYDKMLNEGRLWLCIHASHADKPIKKRLIRYKKQEIPPIPSKVTRPHKPSESLKMKMKTNKGNTGETDEA